jgi:transposase
MDGHKNARLTAKGREGMVRAVVDDGLSKAAAARRFNTTPKTVAKWVKRFRALGVAELYESALTGYARSGTSVEDPDYLR